MRSIYEQNITRICVRKKKYEYKIRAARIKICTHTHTHINYKWSVLMDLLVIVVYFFLNFKLKIVNQYVIHYVLQELLFLLECGKYDEFVFL